MDSLAAPLSQPDECATPDAKFETQIGRTQRARKLARKTKSFRQTADRASGVSESTLHVRDKHRPVSVHVHGEAGPLDREVRSRDEHYFSVVRMVRPPLRRHNAWGASGRAALGTPIVRSAK